jgi:hypothetical protein
MLRSIPIPTAFSLPNWTGDVAALMKEMVNYPALSVHAKIVSQIRGDGVVPFGKYLSMFKAEG